MTEKEGIEETQTGFSLTDEFVMTPGLNLRLTSFLEGEKALTELKALSDFPLFRMLLEPLGTRMMISHACMVFAMNQDGIRFADEMIEWANSIIARHQLNTASIVVPGATDA